MGLVRVVLRSAPAGTGIIAGGPMRAVFETLGVQDVVAKSVGTSNPHNMIKATFNAFSFMNSPRNISSKRGKKVSEIFGTKKNKIYRKHRRIDMKKNTIKIKLGKSGIGRKFDQKKTLVGLGLNKVGRIRELEDTPSIRGMINKVKHLVKII